MTNLMQVTENAVVSMTSRDIAELTGKEHYNVLRDIRSMIDQLDDSILSHEEYQEVTDLRGYTSEMSLNKNLTLTLITGYDINARHKIILRWQELETQLHQLESEKVKDLERRNLQLIHDLSDNISHIASSMNAIKAAENEVKAMKARMSDYIAERVVDLRELSMEMRVANQVGFSEDLVAVVTAMLKDLKGIANPKNEELEGWSLVSKQGLDRYAQERVAALLRQAKIQIPNRNK